MNSVKSLRFRLEIPADRYQAYYAGRASAVLTYSIDGRRVRFPASALRQFLTRDGIYGEFRLHYDDQNRLIHIERLGD